MTNRNTSENYDLFSFFTLLDEYLEIFIHEDITKSQVLLSKLTAEVLERLETQITALVAVLSGVLHFSDDEDIILATCKFLSNWLQCEMRAISRWVVRKNFCLNYDTRGAKTSLTNKFGWFGIFVNLKKT